MMFPPLLPSIWLIIIAFAITMYIILDGFTLGTGILLPFLNKQNKNIAMSIVLPTWDGNQTWLILGAASLYGAFPTAFSALLPVMYLPFFVMILALLLRGVAFEFRLKAQNPHRFFNWDTVFFASSIVVTLIQGMVLGNFVEGFEIGSNPLHIMNPHFIDLFSVFTALALVGGYGLLGATRIVLKSVGDLQKKMYKLAEILSYFLIGCVGVVSLWTPYVNPLIAHRWFFSEIWVYLIALPLLTVCIFGYLVISLKNKKEHIPFWCVIAIFLCNLLGFVISIYPYLIPYKIPFWELAAPRHSLIFTIIGASIMLPVLVGYTWYSYHVFRGKVTKLLEY